jgi:hypothetical protein
MNVSSLPADAIAGLVGIDGLRAQFAEAYEIAKELTHPTAMVAGLSRSAHHAAPPKNVAIVDAARQAERLVSYAA